MHGNDMNVVLVDRFFDPYLMHVGTIILRIYPTNNITKLTKFQLRNKYMDGWGALLPISCKINQMKWNKCSLKQKMYISELLIQID